MGITVHSLLVFEKKTNKLHSLLIITYVNFSISELPKNYQISMKHLNSAEKM